MSRAAEPSSPRRKRRFERALVGAVMAVIAYVAERVVIRSLKRSGGRAASRTHGK